MPAPIEDPEYFVTHGDDYARLWRGDPYMVVAAVVWHDGQWRPALTDVPLPWESVDWRYGTAAEALTALVPYAAAAAGYGSDRQMLDVIAATKFGNS